MPAVNVAGDSSAMDAPVRRSSHVPPASRLRSRCAAKATPGDGTTRSCRLIVVGSLSAHGLVYSTSERAKAASASSTYTVATPETVGHGGRRPLGQLAARKRASHQMRKPRHLAGVVGQLAVRVLRRQFLPPHGAEAGKANAQQCQGSGYRDGSLTARREGTARHIDAEYVRCWVLPTLFSVGIRVDGERSRS